MILSYLYFMTILSSQVKEEEKKDEADAGGEEKKDEEKGEGDSKETETGEAKVGKVRKSRLLIWQFVCLFDGLSVLSVCLIVLSKGTQMSCLCLWIWQIVCLLIW